MTPRLFRPHEPPLGPTPPVGTWALVQLSKVCQVPLLRGLLANISSHQLRNLCIPVLWLVALLLQGVLVWLGWSLLDLYVSAVELWAELARKHLEITLS